LILLDEDSFQHKAQEKLGGRTRRNEKGNDLEQKLERQKRTDEEEIRNKCKTFNRSTQNVTISIETRTEKSQP
jgi:hypothetical protein